MKGQRTQLRTCCQGFFCSLLAQTGQALSCSMLKFPARASSMATPGTPIPKKAVFVRQSHVAMAESVVRAWRLCSSWAGIGFQAGLFIIFDLFICAFALGSVSVHHFGSIHCSASDTGVVVQ